MLENLSNNNEHAESLFVKVIWEKCKNVIFACIYRPAKGNHSTFLGKTKYKEANLFNLVFQIGLCSLIDWPKSISKTIETEIDHILTNTILVG